MKKVNIGLKRLKESTEEGDSQMTEEKNAEVLPEVERELQMGSRGIVRPRVIPLIDLTDFSERRESITEALWDAAANYGFFQLTNHGIPIPQIDSAFLKSKEFSLFPNRRKQCFRCSRERIQVGSIWPKFVPPQEFKITKNPFR